MDVFEQRYLQQAAERAKQVREFEEKQAAERVEHETQRRAMAEEALAPIKQHELRKFLLNHPQETAGSFEAHAWPLIVDEFLSQTGDIQAVKQKKRESGDYGF